MTPLIRSRGYLSHWETTHAIYFVTFRLADSLPRELVLRLKREREAHYPADQSCSAGFQPAFPSQPYRIFDRKRRLRALLQHSEQVLDRCLGACYMRNPGVARIVADSIRHFHCQRYRLRAWCVMPNHVHVLFSPLGEHPLAAILHAWKSYSALEANKLLGRAGAFWQREYFDHLVRNQASLRKITRYVLENPRKAGLHDWPWVEVLT